MNSLAYMSLSNVMSSLFLKYFVEVHMLDLIIPNTTIVQRKTINLQWPIGLNTRDLQGRDCCSDRCQQNYIGALQEYD